MKEQHLDRRLDRYVALVSELLVLEKECRARKDSGLLAKRNGVRQRVKRRRIALLKDGATEKQLEAAYIEAAATTKYTQK